MGNLRNAGYEFPAPSRIAESNDPTAEVERILAKCAERQAAEAMQKMKSARYVVDWRLRFRED